MYVFLAAVVVGPYLSLSRSHVIRAIHGIIIAIVWGNINE